MKIKIIFISIIVIVLLGLIMYPIYLKKVGYEFENPNRFSQPQAISPEQLFQKSLNISSLQGVSEFTGENNKPNAPLETKGMFQYKATADFINNLKTNLKFSEKSIINQQFREVMCDGIDFPANFSYWTKNTITIKEKKCLRGISAPYVHYIIYDPTTNTVDHFVEGMRD
ncbi:MAG: hypothetical protein WCO06_02980 [Candidatus Roizmanbacteria bacterium]